MHCKNLYINNNAQSMMCYDSLSHMPYYLVIEDVCIGVEKLTTYNACDLQGSKIEILKMNGKGNIFLEKETYEFNCACNMSCFTIRGIVCEMFNFWSCFSLSLSGEKL